MREATNEMQEIGAICCVLIDMQLNIFMYVHVIDYHFQSEDEI